MPDSPAILICGHGSTDADALQGFKAFLEALRTCLPGHHVSHGYLELAEPSLSSAISELQAKGFRDIIAVPVLLFTAGHAKHDFPRALRDAAREHGIERIRLARPLGLSGGLVEAARELAASQVTRGDEAETMLLVVGRGTSEPMANGEAAKLARITAETLGLAFSSTAFVAVTTPRLDAALSCLDALPFKKGIVLPLMLFHGMLYKEIAAKLAEHSAACKTQWRLSAPFIASPAWIPGFAERVKEVEQGKVDLMTGLGLEGEMAATCRT